MPRTQPRRMLQVLRSRQTEIPRSLRSLWTSEQAVEAAVDLCDDLLADIDALISVAVAGIEQHLPWEDLAEDAMELKIRVYDDLLAFCTARSAALAPVLQRSSLRDLADSQDRIRGALSRASVRIQPVSTGCFA